MSGCRCTECRNRTAGRRVAMFIAGAIVVLLGAQIGCQAFKKDVVAVADVCRPELLPGVVEIAPYVAAFVSCEIAHADCTSALNDLKAVGKAEAVQCALAEAHEAVVNLAKADGGGQ